MEALALGQQRLAAASERGYKRKDRPKRGESVSSFASSSQATQQEQALPARPAQPASAPHTVDSPDKVTPEPKLMKIANSPDLEADEPMPKSVPRNLEREFESVAQDAGKF